MNHYHLNLEILEGTYCVCKKFPINLMSDIENKSNFFSFTKTADELSVVCNEKALPSDLPLDCERSWKVLKVSGPLDFSLVGILSNLSTLLTKASISIFVISTYDTDYILVKEANLNNAIFALRQGGHIVNS